MGLKIYGLPIFKDTISLNGYLSGFYFISYVISPALIGIAPLTAYLASKAL